MGINKRWSYYERWKIINKKIINKMITWVVTTIIATTTITTILMIERIRRGGNKDNFKYWWIRIGGYFLKQLLFLDEEIIKIIKGCRLAKVKRDNKLLESIKNMVDQLRTLKRGFGRRKGVCRDFTWRRYSIIDLLGVFLRERSWCWPSRSERNICRGGFKSFISRFTLKEKSVDRCW